MAIKKRKKGKSDIRYYGKAADGYDPSTQDGDTWGDGGGGGETNGGGAFTTYKGLSAQTRSGSSKKAVTTKSKTPSKPKPKPGGGRRP